MMTYILHAIVSVLFPQRCVLCRRFLKKDELDLCHDCREITEEYPFGARNPLPRGKNNFHFLDSFTAVWYYEGNVRKCIHRYKFQRAAYLAPRFGRILGMKLLNQGPEQFDLLTWVPVSRKRRFQRGYDQCELLAKAVGKELAVEPICLLRHRHTPPQSGIVTAEERKANVLGAFSVRSDVNVTDKTILILDDVFTTGATLEECARVLLTAGAKEVHGAAIASGSKRKITK